MPYALSELIFCLWCLPVTVFIILPLAILAGWWIKKLVSKENTTQTA
jgi:lipopolysaccharide biosynthesis regulator YciM